MSDLAASRSTTHFPTHLPDRGSSHGLLGQKSVPLKERAEIELLSLTMRAYIGACFDHWDHVVLGDTQRIVAFGMQGDSPVHFRKGSWNTESIVKASPIAFKNWKFLRKASRHAHTQALAQVQEAICDISGLEPSQGNVATVTRMFRGKVIHRNGEKSRVVMRETDKDDRIIGDCETQTLERNGITTGDDFSMSLMRTSRGVEVAFRRTEPQDLSSAEVQALEKKFSDLDI